MIGRRLGILGIATSIIVSLPICAQTAASVQTATSEPVAAPDFAAWDSFTDQLRQLGDEFIAKLPERLRNDPQVQQEVGRYLLEALVMRAIPAISADGDHPVFLPQINVTLNAGEPNPDTTYRDTPITAGGVYRLRGEVGSLRIFNVGEAPPNSTSLIPTYHDFKTLHLDATGHFDVILSPRRPPGYTGDWWQLSPTTTSLGIREVDSDWATERDPTVSIERLDKTVERPRPDAADLNQRLRGLADKIRPINVVTLTLIDQLEALRKQGYVNRLHPLDVSHWGPLPTQFYYNGPYEIKPDEALIVEAKVPSGCLYWETSLANDIVESTDWYNNQSSLNNSLARVDKDGIVRYVVANSDPGVPNWLDTSGYLSGSIEGRWNECSDNPIPTVRKVPLADVRKYLPADTPTVSPAQREQLIRNHRAELQQRPLW